MTRSLHCCQLGMTADRRALLLKARPLFDCPIQSKLGLTTLGLTTIRYNDAVRDMTARVYRVLTVHAFQFLALPSLGDDLRIQGSRFLLEPY